MGISYQWHDGVTGDWQVATNWNPVGVPGSSDFATIGHQSQNTAQTVTGTGSAAALNAFATTTLAGNFSVGGNLTAQFTFQGAFTSFGSLTIDGGSIALGATLIADTLTLSVKNGAAVHALALALGANCNLTVDSASSVMIGSPGNATAGQLTIGSGVRVSVFEDIVPQFRVNSTATLSSPIIVNNGAIGVAGSARTLTIGGTNLINNGTINVTDGQLQILESGGVSGTGTVNVGSNSTLVAGYFGPGTGNTIHLSGITDNLQIPRRLWTLRIRSTRSYFFNDSDVIAFAGANGTGASITYTPSSGISTLNLLNGSQVLASVKLAGNYSNFRFSESTFEDLNAHQTVSQIHLVGSGQASFGSSWNLAGIADFNGDGTSDLVWQQQSSNVVEIHFLSRTTTLGGGTIPSSPFDSSWTVKAVGDFNADGRSDLIYRHACDGLTEIQLLDGQTGIGGGVIANNPFDNGWNIATAGDFNGDSRADLVWRNASNGLVEIQSLNGSNAIGGGILINNPFDQSWNIVGAGDFNGDGKTDLVWQRPTDGLVEIELINGTNVVGGGVISNNPFDASWAVKATSDFSGDGRADLVWQRASDGLTEIQFLNGNSAIGGGAIANSPFDANWSVVGAGHFNGAGATDLVYRNLSGTTTEVQLLAGTTQIGGGIVSMGN